MSQPDRQNPAYVARDISREVKAFLLPRTQNQSTGLTDLTGQQQLLDGFHQQATGRRRGAVLNKQPDLQRFNVGASRARDQMWVFYSFDPGDLHPEDVRRRLVEYLLDPLRLEWEMERLEDKCESVFERDVLRQLLSRGYDVMPQFPVGHLRIDLVVGSSAGRLAVECDGDRYHGPDRWEADLRRQMTLERLGWRFDRIRGTEFYRSPETALEPLWSRLEELGITPLAS